MLDRNILLHIKKPILRIVLINLLFSGSKRSVLAVHTIWESKRKHSSLVLTQWSHPIWSFSYSAWLQVMCYWKPFADETLQALCMFEQWVSNPAFEDVLSSFIPPTSLLPVGTISHRRDKCQKALFNILRMQMTAKYSSSEWNTTIWKLICCLGSCGVCLFEQLINPAIRYVICDFRYHGMSRCCYFLFFFFFD